MLLVCAGGSFYPSSPFVTDHTHFPIDRRHAQLKVDIFNFYIVTFVVASFQFSTATWIIVVKYNSVSQTGNIAFSYKLS